jgi:transposase
VLSRGAAHAASWAGLCPSNRESAGKRLSCRTRNRWLRRALCQSAWAVTHKKNCYLTAHFYRRAAQHGVKKAIVATAHQLLITTICYAIKLFTANSAETSMTNCILNELKTVSSGDWSDSG